MYDLVVRGGTVVDGNGGSPRQADVAVQGDKIVAVGQGLDRGVQEIDATGKIVTPGFVDIHTHYDGQATWDQEMAPSSWHGVTTVVMGNCGVGFAPAEPSRHEWLIGLMEGVEDIPGSALAEGMSWNWETFPEYMDALEALPRTIDVAAQVPHGSVRAYVMGDRGARNEAPTETDIARMAAIVEDGLKAGALGFSTSRTVLHKSIEKELVPGTTATKEELLAIGAAMGRVGHGVFELSSDLVPEWDEFGWMGKLSREYGVPVTYTALQSPIKAMPFDDMLKNMREENAKGANILAQVSMRATGLILGFQASLHPFTAKASWMAIAHKPWEEQWTALNDPEFRARLIAEPNEILDPDLQIIIEMMSSAFNMLYAMGPGFNYEPTAEESIESLASAAGVAPAEYAYDLLLKNEGTGFIYFPLLNWADGNYNFLEDPLHSDDCVNSLSDGGAHCGTICDAAASTYMLQHWVRDRQGRRLSLEYAIQRQCRDTASLYGLNDRGVIESGYLADLNIIDLDAIKLGEPWVAADLPAGGKRLLQQADGYVATIKSGVVTFKDGIMQGPTPGGLIRGPQALQNSELNSVSA
ncbi:MAG: N-acyl-D-amino-acid deacylase family protein [Aequoribacter sp.]|uniref:N-acyl-D-amino-acid deacylase family protein n=1 Tax=Aequoribacter sp. TaxID=2847771 RepID=UPI003C4A1243